MGSTTFPKFGGLTYSTFKKPIAGRSHVSTSSGGKELRYPAWPLNKWSFELQFEYLSERERYNAIGQVPNVAALVDSTNLIANDWAALNGFFLARQGSLDSWLFDDTNDDSIAQAQIGIGDGSTLSFQAVRQIGEFTETIQNLNGTQVLAGTWSANLPVAATSNAFIIPTVDSIQRQSGLQVPWQTQGWPNYYRCTTAGTTGASEPNWRLAPAPGMTVTDGSVVWTNIGVPIVAYVETTTLDWTTGAKLANTAIKPLVNNAGGYTYVCLTNGTSTGSNPTWTQQLGATVVDSGSVSWLCIGKAQVGAINPIVPQLAGFYTLSSTGLLTFATTPPAINAQVFLTSGFYFRCRFNDDVQEFENFMNRFWRLGKLDFQSIIL